MANMGLFASGGMLALMRDSSINSTNGKPNPKKKLIGSRKTSLILRLANNRILILHLLRE